MLPSTNLTVYVTPGAPLLPSMQWPLCLLGRGRCGGRRGGADAAVPPVCRRTCHSGTPLCQGHGGVAVSVDQALNQPALTTSASSSAVLQQLFPAGVHTYRLRSSHIRCRHLDASYGIVSGEHLLDCVGVLAPT